MADEILRFDGHNLTELSKDLRKASVALHRETQKTLLEVGTAVTAAAKEEASQHSKSIPPTIRMRMVPKGVIISAGDQSVPLAALYELGNKGKGGRSSPTFRHPVFGNRETWVEQRRYPYLRSALDADRVTVTKQMEATWNRALGPHRLHPEG